MVIHFTYISVLRVIPLFIIYRYIPVIHANFNCVTFRSLVQEQWFILCSRTFLYLFDGFKIQFDITLWELLVSLPIRTCLNQ